MLPTPAGHTQTFAKRTDTVLITLLRTYRVFLAGSTSIAGVTVALSCSARATPVAIKGTDPGLGFVTVSARDSRQAEALSKMTDTVGATVIRTGQGSIEIELLASFSSVARHTRADTESTHTTTGTGPQTLNV